ncbi:hypothetical protein G9A89_016911 [Geosiphon pyriformis]|nr:hypothetical protein G9A89_016911 [Geosiphon pyriformis]
MATLPIETDIETILFEEITIGNYKNILQKRLGTILDSLVEARIIAFEKIKQPKKTTTKRKKIGSKMDKYLLESITAAILSPFNTIEKTLQEILPIDKNLLYGRQLELYGCFGEIIKDMKLMKKTTSEIQAEILGII